MVRIGIVGTGFMAAAHLKAYRRIASAEIVALGNPSGRNLDGDFSKVGGNVGSPDAVRLDMTMVRAYADLNGMFRDPAIDLVDICTPTESHASLAIAALKAGKHVICEKPLARTSVEAKEMAETARLAGGILMPAMCLRFWPEWAYAREFIRNGTGGKTLAARFRRVSEPPRWGRTHFLDGAKSGGALFDLHIHDTDFIQYCFGKPSAVYSTGYSKVSGAVDHVVTQYQVESGALVHAEGSWVMSPGFGFNMAYTIHCERATLDYDSSRGTESLRLFTPDEPVKIVKLESSDGYVGELQHLIDAIETGQHPTVVTAEDGITAMAICEAEERSIRTGEVVSVP